MLSDCLLWLVETSAWEEITTGDNLDIVEVCLIIKTNQKNGSILCSIDRKSEKISWENVCLRLPDSSADWREKADVDSGNVGI